jgi:hypothetical protein
MASELYNRYHPSDPPPTPLQLVLCVISAYTDVGVQMLFLDPRSVSDTMQYVALHAPSPT